MKVLALALFTLAAAIDTRAEADQSKPGEVAWPFNPYRANRGWEKSPSQGCCWDRPGREASHKCKDEFGGTPITPGYCWENCWCDEGVFKCSAWGGCSAGDMSFWCQCPGGTNEDTNCVGYMTMCGCTPEEGYLNKGVWGDGTKAARLAEEAKNRPGEGSYGLVTDGKSKQNSQ